MVGNRGRCGGMYFGGGLYGRRSHRSGCIERRKDYRGGYKTDTGTDIETIETDVETTKTGSETTELGVEMTETDMGKDKRANREAEVRSDRDGDTENEERKKDTADADEVKKNVTDEWKNRCQRGMDGIVFGSTYG